MDAPSNCLRFELRETVGEWKTDQLPFKQRRETWNDRNRMQDRVRFGARFGFRRRLCERLRFRQVNSRDHVVFDLEKHLPFDGRQGFQRRKTIKIIIRFQIFVVRKHCNNGFIVSMQSETRSSSSSLSSTAVTANAAAACALDTVVHQAP